jgi:hypothetical protein
MDATDLFFCGIVRARYGKECAGRAAKLTPCGTSRLMWDRKTHHALLFWRQASPDGLWNWVDLAAGVGIPPAYITNRHKFAWCVGRVRCTSVQRPRMTNKHVSDFPWD